MQRPFENQLKINWNTSRFKTLKNRQKLRFKIFWFFFRLKPAPGHGLQCYTWFSPTALILWKTIRLGQTDGRTDGRTACQFLGALCFDNHPFGVWLSRCAALQRHQIEKLKQSCRTTPKPNRTEPIGKAIYNKPISQLGLYEWIRNNSTLKNTKPGHTALNANNYGRNGHLKINWKSIEILVDSKL